MSTRKSHRQHHTKTHTGEKTHVCPVCPNSFTEPGDVREHIRAHCKDTHSHPGDPVSRGWIKDIKGLKDKKVGLEPDPPPPAASSSSSATSSSSSATSSLSSATLSLSSATSSSSSAISSLSSATSTLSSATSTPSSAKTAPSSSLSKATPWRASATATVYDRTTAEFSQNEEMSNYQNVDPKGESNDQEGFNNIHLKV